MATAGEVLNRIARQCSLAAVSAWSSETRLSHVEIRDDFLPETIEEIQDRKDLSPPIGKTATITGTGATSYALPVDFKRLAMDDLAVLETTNPVWTPCRVVTDGQWEAIQIATEIWRYVRITGYPGAYALETFPALETGVEIKVSYVSTVWLISGVTEASVFTSDTQILLLPRRLVELGTVMRFRRRKGLDYTDILAEYEGNLDRHDTDFRGRRHIHFARPSAAVGGTLAAPQMAIPI